jgi:hypothetical protein
MSSLLLVVAVMRALDGSVEGHTSRRQGILAVADTTQALDSYLRAAEAHKDALYGLWDGLLYAAPFPGRQEEIRRTMARYEVVVCDLHAMQMRAFDL